MWATYRDVARCSHGMALRTDASEYIAAIIFTIKLHILHNFLYNVSMQDLC